MGAATQKTIKNIIDSKYSFVHPKSHYPLQLSCWRFTEDDLERRVDCVGEAMRWPFKLYSDEGYIFACIENHNSDHHNPNSSSNGPGIAKVEPGRQLGSMRVSAGVIELLYSFACKEVEEYCSLRIELQNKSKYIKDRLTLILYIYTGENLSSLAKLKLNTHATSLERYISRGGICSISKLYHEYEEIVDLGKEIRWNDQGKGKNGDEFYVEIATLIEERVRAVEDGKARKTIEEKELSNLYSKMCGFTMVRKLLLDPYIKQPLAASLTSSEPNESLYPTLDCSAWSCNKNLIIKEEVIRKAVIEPAKEQPGIVPQNHDKADLNQSLPFACEITEINFKQKKRVGEVQGLNESMSMAELSVLNERHANFIRVACEEEDYLVLTDYPSMRDYSRCLELNIRLAVNNSASLCYNYYLNDFDYIWNYITPLPAKPPAEAILFQYNIENLIPRITETILHHTCNNKRGEALNNRVAIYSSGSPFSDENCAIVIGYLICRYLYSFEKAFNLLGRLYSEHQKSKEARLELHRLYVDQLLGLQERMLATSLPGYVISPSQGSWRVYQVSNNHCHPAHQLISRYIGQIKNLNQIPSLPNHSKQLYIVVAHQAVPALTQAVEKWEKDSTIRVPVALSGIKVLVGKEFQFREEFVSKAKEMLPYILKYEFVSRSRNSYSFLNPFLLSFIREVVQANLQIQTIEKSFRRPQPFTPLYCGFEEETPGKQGDRAGQPFSSKQKLVFKYPYLRPTWEAIREDQHYFIIQIRPENAVIEMVKGKQWIGLENDKEAYLESLVKLYIESIDESKIEIVQEGEGSLFADHVDL